MITVAKNAGFCFGVKLATDCIEKLLSDGKTKKIFTLGKLIHNEVYINGLKSRGVYPISENDIESIAASATEDNPVVLVIRAHGITVECDEKLRRLKAENKNFSVIDMTCPYVKRIHKIAEENTGDNTQFILLGNYAHPEVLGIMSYAKGDKTALPDSRETEKFLIGNRIEKQIISVSQTTQSTEEWKKTQKIIKKLYTNAIFFDTICSVTEKRQEEAEALAKISDAMIVIGGKESSNTRKLYEICRKNCGKTYWLETPDELPPASEFRNMNIGITAGASTPANLIMEVQGRMNTENLDFESMLEDSLKTLHTGETVHGYITAISDAAVYLDLGTKVTGVIAKDQITSDEKADLKKMFRIGDEVDAFVIRVNDKDGIAELSKKRVDADKAWLAVIALKESGEPVEGKITDAIHGGVLVDIGGFKVFMPASRISINHIDDLTTLVGTVKKVVIIDVDKAKKRAVCSARVIEEAEKKAIEDKVWETLEEGQHFRGTVKNFIQSGAFVNIGGVDGFIPNIELSWKRIKHPSQVLTLGAEVEVYIKDLDREKRKITLGYRTEEMDPFYAFKNTYKVGDVVDAKIVSIMPFGAFGEVMDGVDGLIHISKISREKVNKPEDVLKIGDIVKAKITEIDVDNRKFNLSIRALEDEAYNAQKAQERAAARAEREAQRKAEAEEKAQLEAEMAPYIVRTID